MSYRRNKVSNQPKYFRGKRKRSPYQNTNLNNLVRNIAKDTIMANAETIKSVSTITDGQQIAHNSYISLADNLLTCSNGDDNPNNTNVSNRIGDQISLKGVSIKFMVELNERFSDVTFRLMVIKTSRDDNPVTSGNLWTGTSSNKMLDTVNTDRYDIMYQKYFKMKAPNPGSWGASVPALPQAPAGLVDADENPTLSRATKIVKCWIPGNKFSPNGVIQFQNAGARPKFFDYMCVLYAYSNYSTSDGLVAYNVARLNDVVTVSYYKDF